MAEVVLFHHVQGLTDGVRAFAEELRAEGHTVHTPDLFDGARPESIDDGLAYAGKIGDEVLTARVDASVATFPTAWCTRVSPSGSAKRSDSLRLDRVRAGRSSTRAACRSPESGPSDPGRRASRSVHGMEKDPVFGLDGDLDAARELVDTVGPALAELFVYPGDRHLFTDSSLPSHDAEATALVAERSREFLDRVS